MPTGLPPPAEQTVAPAPGRVVPATWPGAGGTFGRYRIERHLDGVRYRTRRMLQQQGATRAEIDDTLAWCERETQREIRKVLAEIRAALAAGETVN